MKVSVYCSGSITKGADVPQRQCWTEAERQQVQRGAQPLTVTFFDPADPIVDPTNVIGQCGRDFYQVQVAYAVIVDARERRGLGIGVELAAAATMGTPVIMVAPRNSHYRKDQLAYRGVEVIDYLHPHIAVLALAIVDDFVAAGNVLQELPAKPRPAVDLPHWLARPINEYRDHILPRDRPMLAALANLTSQPPLDERNWTQ